MNYGFSELGHLDTTRVEATWRLLTSTGQTEEALSLVRHDNDLMNAVQAYSEDRLACAGAELSLNFHTDDEKTLFSKNLSDYLAVTRFKTSANLEARINGGGSPGTAVGETIGELIGSTRRVLRQDIDYRLANSRRERIKQKVANSSVSRLLGKAALYSGQGAALYLVGKGFISQGDTAHNYLLAASAASAQITGRAFGQELARQGNLQLAEYIPTKNSADSEADDDVLDGRTLSRHEAHLALKEGSLFAVAGQYSLEGVDDTSKLANDLTVRVGDWFNLYYKQPTLRDRLDLIAWGGSAAITTALTILQI